MATGVWIRASIMFQDYGGIVAKTAVLVAAAALDPSGTAVAAIRAAMLAITKAKSPKTETGTMAGAAGSTSYGTTPYGSVEDRMTLTFRGDDGSTITYEVPAPLAANFVAGTDDVDPTVTAVDTYITYIETNCCGPAEQTLTFVNGRRTRKKQMKK